MEEKAKKKVQKVQEVKVKVLEKFKDKYTGKVHKKGETFFATKERIEEILKVGKLVEEYKEEKSEKSAE